MAWSDSPGAAAAEGGAAAAGWVLAVPGVELAAADWEELTGLAHFPYSLLISSADGASLQGDW